MKKVLIILILFVFTAIAFAEGGRFGDNWCNEGGPLEGTCTIPGDEALTNYMWELGWYLAAVDNHDIALEDIPARYIKQNADTTEDGDDDGPLADCNGIRLPNMPNGAATVTGELEHDGVTYQSATIPSSTYETYAEGQTYDPSTVGRKHKVKIIAKDADGNVIKKKSYKFRCPGDFDPTAGGIIPSP